VEPRPLGEPRPLIAIAATVAHHACEPGETAPGAGELWYARTCDELFARSLCSGRSQPSARCSDPPAIRRCRPARSKPLSARSPSPRPRGRGHLPELDPQQPPELWVSSITQRNDGAYHHANWFFVPDDQYELPDGTWSCSTNKFSEVAAALLGGYLFAMSTQSHEETQQLPTGNAIRIRRTAA